ncbi:hypothetical protein ACFL43_01600 [Thermodesulfobacteriota bacterium]
MLYENAAFRKALFVIAVTFPLLCCSCSAAEKEISSGGQELTLKAFPDWMYRYYTGLQWQPRAEQRRLSRAVLQQSLALGRRFLLNNQKPAGNFNYQYDFVKKELDQDDNQVRQAGALWGLALLYQYEQDPATRKALDAGLGFFLERSSPGPVAESLMIEYPGDASCGTGTVALVAMSIVEYLRTEQAGGCSLTAGYRDRLRSHLRGYVEHLKAMRREDKHFTKAYYPQTKSFSKGFSSYYDGETILCLIKAAKYLGYTELIPLIEESALAMAKYYTADQWPGDPDSKQTKGFFQWSCMAFWEYQDAGWKHADTFGDYVLSLAWWMIRTHRTLNRTRNTAYAYEGIIHAYRLAQDRGDKAALQELAYTIDTALYKLTSWQVGGPLQRNNKFLRANPTSDPLAVGGIMNHRKEAPLRIDVTQHQTHALILALKHVYVK